MIPLPAYEVIRAVNRVVDLTQPPTREYNHSFGDIAASSHDDESGGGGGIPAARSRLDILRAVARFLTARRQQPLTNPLA